MTPYATPIDDYEFLYDVLGLDELSEIPAFAEVGKELALQVIGEAGRFATEVLAPLNRSSDETGAEYSDGEVRTPPGFGEAYRLYREGGWPSLTGPSEFGGQQLPGFLAHAMSESVASTCMSFGQYTGLTHAAAMAIEGHAEEWMKELYLPRMVAGEWGGTMCLTESHAGTDLGLMRTRAVPSGNGTFAVTGTKIFITAGEHDLTGNIVHLVLAKLPDAPPGVRGISLFLVPKFLPDDAGEPGQRNGVRCGSIEHKMGMKGSVACVMNFDGATGWMIGEPHKGLKAMFTMMNTARLLTSAQGPGAAEAAYQSAVAYARDRLQGRSASGAKAPEQAADPLIVHPDVRRMLLEMRIHAEGGRALALWVMKQSDIATHHPEEAVRESAGAFLALMTPIVKVWLSETGLEAANLGVQVFGGHGYIREWGMEQLVRDVRLVPLYEGANGIQALDLVGRKLPMDGGRMLRHLLDPIDGYLADEGSSGPAAEFRAPLGDARRALDEATSAISVAGAADPDEVGAASMDYLKIAGYLAQAYLWALMGSAAIAKGDANPRFHASKLAAARFFFAKMVPFSQAHLSALKSGAAPVMALAADAF